MITQTAPHIITGTLSEIPDPSTIPDGYLFYAVDVQELFVLVINQTTQLRAWEISSSSTTIPLHRGLLVGSGSYPAGVNLLFVQTNGVGTTVTLPNVNAVIDGEVLYLKDLTSTAAITLVVPAGNTLEGVLNGTQVLAGGGGDQAVMLVADKTTGGWWILSESLTGPNTASIPSNPQYFVSNAGNDGPTHSGSATDPLATVTEALRRLKISSWSGQPVITQINNTNEGANPSWDFPSPPSGSSPILLQGTSIQTLGPTAPTGGTTGTQFGTIALPTITSSAAGGANAYRQQFLRFTSGPLAGIRAPIVSNDGAGGFSLAGGQLSAAPVASDLFVVEDVSKITFTGNLRISAMGGAFIDGIEFTYPSGGNILITSGCIQVTAVRLIAGATACGLVMYNGSSWQEVGIGLLAQKPAYTQPVTALPCGGVYDGTASSLQIGSSFTNSLNGNGRMFFIGCMARGVDFFTSPVVPSVVYMYGLCSLDTCGIALSGSSGLIASVLITNGRKTPGTSSSAVIYLTYCAFITLSSVTINSSQANSNGVAYTQTKSQVINLKGSNPNTGIVPMTTSKTSSVELVTQPTISGTVAGNDCVVGGNPVDSWANVFGGTSVHSTDLAAASSQICRVGP